ATEVNDRPESKESKESKDGKESIGEKKKEKEAKKTRKIYKQTEADTRFRAEKLIDLLLQRLIADTKSTLAKLSTLRTPTTTVPKEFLHLHPCALLLWHLQYDLLKKAACCKNPEDSEVKFMVNHVKRVVSASKELLENAEDLFSMKEVEVKFKQAEQKSKKPLVSTPKPDAKPKESKPSKTSSEPKASKLNSSKPKGSTESKEGMGSDAAEKPCKKNVDKKTQKKKSSSPPVNPEVSMPMAASTILFNSVAGEVLNVSLLALFSSVFQPSYGCLFAEKLVDEVADLLLTLDRIVTGKEKTREARGEEEFMRRFGKSSQLHSNPIIVETPHTYFNAEPDRIVSIPGATHLSLEFDPRCSTEHRRDFLTITTPNGVTVCDDLHGRPDQWPDVPIIVPGDTAIFTFRADSFNHYFGYRCLVSGLYLGDEKAGSGGRGSARGGKEERKREKGRGGGKKKGKARETKEGDEDEDGEAESDSADREPSKPSPLRLLDLSRTCAHVLGRCLRALSVGTQVTTAERKAHKWLASPLFAGGPEATDAKTKKSGSPTEDFRLEDLVENREGSLAAKVHTKMKSLLPKKIHDRLGGEVVQHTLRQFIAIVLKHLGLLPIAEDFAIELESKAKDPQQAISREKLRMVWARGQEFHLLISSEYSKNKMAFFAREEKMKETKEQWDEEELKEAKARLTWEGFCKSLDDRCKLLLGQNPFFMASEATRRLLVSPPRLTRVSSAYKPGDKDSAVHTSLTSLYSAFDVVQSSKSKLDAPTREEQQSAFRELTDLVTQFATSPHPALCLQSAVVGLMNAWGTPFRQYSAYARSEAVHEQVTGLYRTFARMLKDTKTPNQLKALCIDAWALDLLPHDHRFILKTGILQVLREVGDEKNLTLIGELARSALHLLCVNILDCSPAVGSLAADTKLDRLQAYVLEKETEGIMKGIDKMLELRNSLTHARATQLELGHNFCVKPKTMEEKILSDVLRQSAGGSQQGSGLQPNQDPSTTLTGPARIAQMYIKTEADVFNSLNLICTSLGGFATQAAFGFLSAKSSLEVLLKVLSNGTLRMQRVVLRTFRVVLPKVDPTMVDTACKNTGWGSDPPSEIPAGRFIHSLFRTLGEACITQESKTRRVQSPVAFRNGQAVLAHGSDTLALLRTLLATEWAKEIRALIDYSLGQIPKLVGKGKINKSYIKNHKSDLPCVMAAFSIIGGYEPQLVVGGRIENVRSSSGEEDAMRETGDLVYLDRASNCCRVRFDHNPSRVVECEAGKIRPIDPVAFSPDAFTLTKDHLLLFEVFTKVLGEDASNELRRKVEEEKAKEEEESKQKEEEEVRKLKEMQAASAEWSCGACTLINQPSSRTCVVCGTPRPAAPEPEPTPEEDTNEKEEKKEKKIDPQAFLYRTLRSLALQSLCTLIRSEKSSQLLVGSSMLPALLGLATQPTALDSYKSVDQLKAEQERLHELLLQQRDGVVDQSRVFERKAKGNSLDHSPFKNLAVQLPNALDTASSRAMTFVDDELSRVTFNGTKMIGAVRSNHKIPNSLQAYYFEITVEDEGVPAELVDGTSATVKDVKQSEKDGEKSEEEGEKEKKKELKPSREKPWVPGSRNSYALNSSGELVSTVSRVPVRKDFDNPFKTGDTLGCGWDVRRRKVFFTKNGKMIEPKRGTDAAFDSVDGFFYPVVWCQNAGATVRVNFGQEPWVYDFRNTLPSHYLKELERADSKSEKKNWKASEAEIRRKTMAQDLVVMMGIYPQELCEVALERCGDDLTHAANWLIEHGRRELEIMTNNMIRASEMEAEKKQLAAAGVVQKPGTTDDDSDGEDLVEWLTGNGNVSGDPSTQRRAAAASFLDDEIERDVPVGVERQEIRRDQDAGNQRNDPPQAQQASEDQVQMTYDNYKIEDIQPGQTVSVNPLGLSIVGENSIAPGPHRRLFQEVLGRSVLVARVEVNYNAVQVLFSDVDRGTQHCLWLPLRALLRPTGQLIDPCRRLIGEPWDVIAQKYMEVEQALSVRKVRDAVVGLVAQKWPKNVPFGLVQLGGEQAVLSILKLTAAEKLSTILDDKKSGTSGAGTPLLEAFREKIIAIVHSEWESAKKDPEVLEKPLYNPEAAHKAIQTGTFTRVKEEKHRPKCPLIQTLLDECILHFAQAVQHPPPVLVYKSTHPYKSHHEIREEVHIPGASKLLVTFDSRCHLGNDILTRLCFYRDGDYQDLISQNNGRGSTRYPSFVVPGDRLWFRFTTGNNNNLWGFKFRVKPVEFRLDDQQALSSYNFELGRWLFELFLSKFPTEVTERFIVELYDAITLYVIHSKPSAKIKGVNLLIQFLLHVHRMPKLRLSLLVGRMRRVPDLKKLKPLTREMDAVMGSIDVNRTLHSQTLQALMELLATADLVQKDFSSRHRVGKGDSKDTKDTKEGKETKYTKQDPGKDNKDSKLVDVSRLGVRRLVLVEAKYGAASSSGDKDCIDITQALRTHIQRSGGTQLMVPCTLQELAKLKPFAIDPATGRDKKLRMKYRIEAEEYVPGQGIVTRVIKESVSRNISFSASSKSTANLGDGEATHMVVQSTPSMFEQVVRISQFTLQSKECDHLIDEADAKEETKTSQKKFKVDLEKRKADKTDSKESNEGKTPFSRTNLVASDEFISKAIKFWSLEQSHMTFVAAEGNGLEFQGNTMVGYPNPGHFGNTFSVTMWLFVQKAPKKGSSPRGILHRGYHIGTGDNAAQKYGFRRGKLDISYLQFAIVLGAKDNTLFVHCNGKSGASFARINSKKPIPLRRWIHLAVVSRGHLVEVYLDGVLEGVLQLPEPAPSSTAPIILGRGQPGFRLGAQAAMGGRPGGPPVAAEQAAVSAECVMKDVRWYVRDITKTEINSVINACTAKGGKRTSLKGFQLQLPQGAPTGGPRVEADQLDTIEALSRGEKVKVERKGLHTPDPAIWRYWAKWNPKMDSQVLRLFGEIAELEQKNKGIARKGTLPSLLNVSARTVKIPEKLLRTYHLLKDLPEDALRMRFLFIQILNVRILSVLPMVDFSQALSPWSLAHRISMLSHLIFLEIKNIAWTHILNQTSTGRGHYVNINQPRALKARERGDRSGRKSVFFQLYLQLHFIKPSVLRSDGRPWVVSYQGFGGQDAGGLFRDSVSTICSELHSPWVPLFVPVPNSKDGGVGDNQEKWIPNPSCRSALHISNYAFVGKLMGVAIRGSHMLNLDLPSLVWKPLVGENVTLSDVKTIDVISCGLIEKLSTAGAPGSDISKENYEDYVPESFVMIGYDDKQVELKENGKDTKPTWENRLEYINLLKVSKLNEVRSQVAAIRKGLGTIVPIQLLPLFTWQELEMMVCGKREIDIDYLKANTRYRAPVTEKDTHVQLLWEVLKDFSHDERRLFLRFVWGQSRLPYNPADFKQKFEILACRDNSNNALPVSHTCFFSVELPRYTKKSAMREKILYAITNCQSIDTDHAAQNVNWDE
ncbi:hypothetical protein AAMO2058_001385000, partial [Amorphochlora amoebiformis]